jgi:putative ubiquitin-RnfH superfamily antitoxin RatB of RatAB toxin-antitoxin module
MAIAEEISVEVVVAVPDRQELCSLRLPKGASVASALEAAGVQSRFPEIEWTHCRLALWGTPVGAGRALRDGDRVEVLRPLRLDPRDARRELARDGQYMSTTRSDEN